MRKRTVLSLVIVCVLLLALAACNKEPKKLVLEAPQGQTTAVKDSTPSMSPEEAGMGVITPLVPELPAGQFYTVMFNDVRVRETPSLQGKVITTAQTGEKMKSYSDMGDVSENTDTVELRGVRYTAHWYKVITPGGHEGWIYGAAIGRYLTATKV